MGKYLDMLERSAESNQAERGNGQRPASASRESETTLQRFGQPHARLFPYLGRKVRTSAGPGTLVQVFADRVTVLLDVDLEHCSWFKPEEIETI